MGWLIGRLAWPLRSRRVDDDDEWLQIVDGFVQAAQITEKAGWRGVQVHSAHGYLLAEYLSPLVSSGWSKSGPVAETFGPFADWKIDQS